jgi:hypothetical protein
MAFGLIQYRAFHFNLLIAAKGFSLQSSTTLLLVPLIRVEKKLYNILPKHSLVVTSEKTCFTFNSAVVQLHKKYEYS